MDQRRGFMFGLPVGAVVGAIVALAVSGTLSTGDSGASPTSQVDSTTASPQPTFADDVVEAIRPTGVPTVIDGPRGNSAIPTPAQATTLVANARGIHTSNGDRLTGSTWPTAFAIDGVLIYQLQSDDSPILIDRGVGADVLASADEVELALMAVGYKDGEPIAMAKLFEPAVIEGLETSVERLVTISISTGEVIDYGIVAGFESILTSVSIGRDGFVLGIIAEGEAFLETLGFDGAKHEIIVPCFGGTCPRTPWISEDGNKVAYMSGEEKLVIYDLDAGRVFTDVDLIVPAAAPATFSGWSITDFDGVTVAVSATTSDTHGNLTYGEARLVTVSGDVTAYPTPGAVTFVR